MTHEELLFLLEGDLEVYDELVALGLLARAAADYSREDAERARVARTLVRELEVNWPGVEVALRMRAELIATRRQTLEIVMLLSRE